MMFITHGFPGIGSQLEIFYVFMFMFAIMYEDTDTLRLILIPDVSEKSFNGLGKFFPGNPGLIPRM